MAEEMRGMLQALNSLVEMQKRFVNTWENASARFDRIDTESIKSTRHILRLQEDVAALRSEMSAFRSDMTARVDALTRRMDEFENSLDRNTEEGRSARTEIVGLENEILNAVQSGLSNMADANELRERLDELERRIAP